MRPLSEVPKGSRTIWACPPKTYSSFVQIGSRYYSSADCTSGDEKSSSPFTQRS